MFLVQPRLHLGPRQTGWSARRRVQPQEVRWGDSLSAYGDLRSFARRHSSVRLELTTQDTENREKRSAVYSLEFSLQAGAHTNKWHRFANSSSRLIRLDA